MGIYLFFSGGGGSCLLRMLNVLTRFKGHLYLGAAFNTSLQPFFNLVSRQTFVFRHLTSVKVIIA